MSNSERHQENRRERAKQKLKEGRIMRNAGHGGRFSRGRPRQLQPTGPSLWQRFLEWLKRIFRKRSKNG